MEHRLQTLVMVLSILISDSLQQQACSYTGGGTRASWVLSEDETQITFDVSHRPSGNEMASGSCWFAAAIGQSMRKLDVAFGMVSAGGVRVFDAYTDGYSTALPDDPDNMELPGASASYDGSIARMLFTRPLAAADDHDLPIVLDGDNVFWFTSGPVADNGWPKEHGADPSGVRLSPGALRYCKQSAGGARPPPGTVEQVAGSGSHEAGGGGADSSEEGGGGGASSSEEGHGGRAGSSSEGD